MKNPYEEYLTDEASGIEYKNPDYRIWQAGYEAGRQEQIREKEQSEISSESMGAQDALADLRE